MQRTGNPAFSASVLDKIAVTGKNAMTVKGTYVKTFFLLLIVIVSAGASWQWMQESIVNSDVRWLPLWIASLVSLFMGMVIAFNPKKAALLSVPYALIQGAFLGIISGVFAQVYDGIVGQAVFTTLAVFLAVFAGYSLGVLRATATFARIIITAMLGIIMYSMLSWIFSLFTAKTPVIYSYGNWGIAFSVAVVVVAALSLVLDFDFIDRAAKEKYPKYFEWYGAFGLMVGLIWLYIEILRLMAKIAARSQR